MISLDTVESRWQDVERIVEEMKHVARERAVSNVPANLASCTAYRGCAFAGECPRGTLTAIKSAMSAAVPIAPTAPKDEKKTMGLLDKLSLSKNKAPAAPTPPATATPAPAPAPTTPPAPAATPANNPAVAAEVARLQAEEAALKGGGTVPTPPNEDRGTCPADGAPLTRDNSSRLPNGNVVHVGCAVLPPDAPASNPAKAAMPIPADAMGALPPNVQAAAMAHASAAATAATVPSTTPAAAPTSADTAPVASPPPARRGRPPKAATTPAPAAESTMPPATTMPNIKITGAVFNDMSGNPAAVARVVSDALSDAADNATSPVFTGRILFVDCVTSMPVQDFAAYVDRIHADLRAAYDVIDIRCAPADGPLGYGKWKGALSAAIRENPPEAIPWSVTHARGDEVMAVAIEAVRPMCAAIVRGVA